MEATERLQKSSAQRMSKELVELICKLQWMGLEEEAETLADELARLGATDTLSVVAPSRETD